MRVAILRLSSLGDNIISLSALSCIRQFYPDIILHWYVDSRFKGVFSQNQILDELYCIPLKRMLKRLDFFGLWRLYRELSRISYDCVIDMQGLLKSAVIGKILKKSRFVGFDRESIKEKLASNFYTHTVHIDYSQPILLRNVRLIYDALLLDQFIDFDGFFQGCIEFRDRAFSFKEKSRLKILQLLDMGIRDLGFSLESESCRQVKYTKNQYKENQFQLDLKVSSQKSWNRRVVLFILEASLPSKSYSSSHFIKLGRLLREAGMVVVILWHTDSQKAKKIADALDNAYLLPRLSLDEVKALMVYVDIVVGGDTGVTHLAWAMKRASITLYGNTPRGRFSLPSPFCISLCGNTNPKYKRNDFSINQISPVEVFTAIRQIL